MFHQPQGAFRIADSNPATRGIRALVIPGAPELVTGAMARQAFGTATEIGFIQSGRAWNFASNPVDYPNVPYQAGDFSILVVVRKGASVADALVSFGGIYMGRGWKFGSGGAASTAYLTYGAVADYTLASNFWDTSGGITIALLTVKGTTAKLYKGGRLIATVTVGTPGVGARPLTIGAGYDASSSGSYGDLSTSAIALAVVWGRGLPEVEAIPTSANPNGLVEELDTDYLIAASSSHSYTFTAAPGTFGFSGAAAGMIVTRRLAGGNGSFSLTGTAAALRAGRKVIATTGVITLSGAPAALTASRKLTAAPGAYVLQGADASLTVARRLAAAAGAFTLAGGDAQLVYTPIAPGQVIATASGQFVLTGSAVAMRVTRRMQAAPGSFAFAGSAAEVRYTSSTGVHIDISKISPARIVVFEGSGSRVTPFESSGSRVTPFDSSGSRVTLFEGSGSKTVRFE